MSHFCLVEVLADAKGQTINEIRLDAESSKLYIEFENGKRIAVFDDGQRCCESRYMKTDDNLKDFIGAKLLDIEIKEGHDIEGSGYGDHEVQFLDISTDRGVITFSNHNEHNGCYSGFSIVAKEEK